MANAAQPPGGIVTFVFTDIEGSTRLLRRLGDQVVICARRAGQPVVTSDNEDLRRLDPTIVTVDI